MLAAENRNNTEFLLCSVISRQSYQLFPAKVDLINLMLNLLKKSGIQIESIWEY